MNNSDLPRSSTVSDFAGRHSLSLSAVYRLIRSGALSAYKVNKRDQNCRDGRARLAGLNSHKLGRKANGDYLLSVYSQLIPRLQRVLWILHGAGGKTHRIRRHELLILARVRGGEPHAISCYEITPSGFKQTRGLQAEHRKKLSKLSRILTLVG